MQLNGKPKDLAINKGPRNWDIYNLRKNKTETYL